MAAKPAPSADSGDAPKSKKKLILVIVLLALLAAGGAGAWLVMSKSHEDDGEEEVSHAPVKKGPPTYLAVDMMVVNLADPGGDKVAQLGITLELTDAKASDKVKAYMPTIRNAILMLVSQRTSEELLQREGKEKLSEDIFKEASRPFIGDDVDDEKTKKDEKPKKKKSKKEQVENPVSGVLFSSLIVQ